MKDTYLLMLRMFLLIMRIPNGLQREIGGRLWLLLLSFYGIYYAAYLYLVYKILQSLPGGYCFIASLLRWDQIQNQPLPFQCCTQQYTCSVHCWGSVYLRNDVADSSLLYRLWKLVPKQYDTLCSIPFKLCFRQIERLHVSILNEQQVRTY